MTTKFFDNKICDFNILLSWRFPRKTAFWTIFLSAPRPPPLKTDNFWHFTLVTLRLCDPRGLIDESASKSNSRPNDIHQFWRVILRTLSSWEFAKGGGGKTYRAILGGGKTYHKAPPPKPVLEASESGICLVCARFL